MVYDKRLVIQRIDEKTEQWSDYIELHARINKTQGSENFSAGAIRSKRTLNFDFRYSKLVEDISIDPQSYRIFYRGHQYNIIDSDDYMEQHRTIRLVGELY